MRFSVHSKTILLLSLLDSQTKGFIIRVKGSIESVGETSTKDPVTFGATTANLGCAAITISINSGGPVFGRKFNNMVFKCHLEVRQVFDFGTLDSIKLGVAIIFSTKLGMETIS
jgi:hypothetical protein